MTYKSSFVIFNLRHFMMNSYAILDDVKIEILEHD